MNEIRDQGEGNVKENQTLLTFDANNMPVPLPVVNGAVTFQPGDYDDATGTELSHFAKFMEIYSLGVYYQQLFVTTGGLDDFFSYFVINQASNPKQATYDALSAPPGLALCSQLGNAIFTYILLMIETCYYQDENTQYDVFMYGIHKSMIWLLSGVGNSISSYTYTTTGGQTYAGSLTFEYYPFENYTGTPKEQIIALTVALAAADSSWSWLTNPQYANYWPSLPDVGLDHSVVPNVPQIPNN